MSIRRRLAVVALLSCTALTPPDKAHAGVVVPFFQGIAASLGAYGAAGAAVGTAIGGAAGLGVAFGTLAFGTFVGRAVLALGVSAIISALTPQPSIPKPSAQMSNFVQAATYFERGYGETKSGGPFVFRPGLRNNDKHYVVCIAGHPTEGPVTHYLDLQEVEVALGSTLEGVAQLDDHDVITKPFRWTETTRTDDDPPVTVDYERSYANLRWYTGQPGQTADPLLVSTFPEITAAHDFKGLSVVAVQCKDTPQDEFLDVYTQGREPTYSGVWRWWNEIYDPRDGSTGWSSNWALCFAHELANYWKLEVDWDRVAVEADVCDGPVTNRNGAQQRRWTFNHKFKDDQDFEIVRAQFMGAADGYLWERPDGKVDFYAGRWIAPTLHLRADDFFSLSVVDSNFGLTPPTHYVANYREPLNDYRETPTGAFVVEDTTSRRTMALELYGIDTHNQACRAIKRLATQQRGRFKMQGTVGLIGYEILAGRANDAGGSQGLMNRFVTVTHPSLGDAVTCEVNKLERNPDGFTFEVELTSADETDLSFNAALEEPTPPVYRAADVAESDAIANIPDLIGEAVTGTGDVAQIKYSWTSPGNSLIPVFRMRRQGEATWNELPLSERQTEYTATGLIDGATYEAQIRARTSGFRSGDWKPDSPVTTVAVANTVAPQVHAAFSSTLSGSDVTLDFTAPSDENYYATRIFRADYAAGYSGSYDIADAVLVRTEFGNPGQVDSWTDLTLSTGHYAWWIVPINGSGVEGPATGPETQDIP